MKLNIFGQIDGETGYALHTRNLSKALMELDCDVGLEGCASEEKPWADMCKKNYKKEATLLISTPNIWRIKFPDRAKKLIGYGVFEGSPIPENWVNVSNDVHMDSVWVPSNHVKESFVNSGVTKPIEIVPHGVDEKVFNLEIAPEPTVDKDEFNFCFCGGWKDGVNDRKGLDLAARAFCEEFGPEEKVSFYAKVNMAYQDVYTVQRNFESLNLPKKEKRRPFNLLTSQIGKEDLAAMYRACDVIVAPSKAEGFNLPVAEAMACGCTPIVTDYGGQLDYVKGDYLWRQIRSTEFPATGGVWYDQATWHMPDVNHLKQLMREVFEKKDEVRAQKKKVSDQILSNWTWKNSAEKALKLLGGV
jgi:glycosyltransferase involved in cell wall biosynthesis